MKTKYFAIAILAAAVAAVSCKKDDPVEPSVSVNPTSISAPATGYDATLTVEANGSYTVVSSESWVTVSPTEAAASVKSVSVVVAPNESTSPRNATITVRNGSASATVSVSQPGAEPPAPVFTGAISSVDDFLLFLEDPTKDATLEADIDLAGTVFPLVEYSGTFDGKNHKINLNIEVTEGAGAGLFSTVSGTVKNLKVSGNVSSTVKDAGAIAGVAAEGAVFENCENLANVIVSTAGSAAFQVGGIVGIAKPSVKFVKCTNKGTVGYVLDGKAAGKASQVGGIAGCITGVATFEDCTNEGVVRYSAKGTSRLGGMVGYLDDITNLTFTKCVNNGTVLADVDAASSGYQYVGGLTGYYAANASPAVNPVRVLYKDCVNNGEVKIEGNGTGSTRSGGIAAYIGITDSKSKVLTQAGQTVDYLFEFEGCKNNAAVSTDGEGNNNHLGGILGMGEAVAGIAKFKDCVNDAPVSVGGTGYAGAIVGNKAAPTTVFENVTITKNTVLTAKRKIGAIATGTAYTTAITGKVGSVTLVNGEEKTVLTADNYKDYLVGTALGEGGSVEGVVFGD